MKISEHLDKNNLHHAYLIEGKKEEIVPQVLDFIKRIGIKIIDNPDLNQITQDSFKINDARNLKSQSTEKGISGNKKVFIVSVNNFLIEAQNTLLKMFEEPIEGTIFFLIVPDTAIILPTLLSRFYLIKSEINLEDEKKQAEEFISMSLNNRISFMKELVANKDEAGNEDDSEFISLESNRSKAIKFLNALETVLHQKFFHPGVKPPDGEVDYFYQILKARNYLNQPGSAIKSLMESVALVVPKL
jgi:hypothetical protein